MSRMEPDQYINDRYQAIEDRLKVGCHCRCRQPLPACLPPPFCRALHETLVTASRRPADASPFRLCGAVSTGP